jgi:hypothetical protein
LDEVACYSQTCGRKTHSVGGKKPSELGIYDTSGNVWEWCNTIYKSYNNLKADSTKSDIISLLIRVAFGIIIQLPVELPIDLIGPPDYKQNTLTSHCT